MAEPKEKPTEQEEANKPEEAKNVDRDGGSRQPTDQTADK